MATALPSSLSTGPVRYIYYGNCRLTGKLRTRAYIARSDNRSARYRAACKAGEELARARFVTTARGRGDG